MASASDEFQRAISSLYSLHTSEVLFLSPQKVSQKSLTKVAQVCWIMDTGECQCDYCEGYDYTAGDIPAGYVADGDACNSCNGPRYKIKPNPCYGYMECEREPAKNATTCLSGDKLLYSDCNDCDPDCPYGTTETNPGGCGGSTTNECGDKTCYYPYEACCTDECPSYTKSSPSSCTYGATSCYDSCFGRTWYKCNDAPKDPCKGVSCPTARSCSYGCASYSSATGCCSRVCTSCNPDPCAGKTGVTCGSTETCASYDSCGNCSSCRKKNSL